jgi:hypothetical protein
MAFIDGEPDDEKRNGIQIWDARSGRLTREATDRAFTASWAVRMRDDGSVFAVSVNSQSQLDQRARIVRWDSRTGDQVITTALPATLAPRAETPTINGGATMFAILSERGADTEVFAFDAATGAARPNFPALIDVGFAQRGEAFIGCDGKSIRVWRRADDPAPITLDATSAQSRCSASLDRTNTRILLGAGPTGGGPLQLFTAMNGGLLRRTP